MLTFMKSRMMRAFITGSFAFCNPENVLDREIGIGFRPDNKEACLLEAGLALIVLGVHSTHPLLLKRIFIHSLIAALKCACLD